MRTEAVQKARKQEIKDHQRANRERVEFAVEDAKHLILCLSPGSKAVPVLRSGIKSEAQAKRLIHSLKQVERLAREVVNEWNAPKSPLDSEAAERLDVHRERVRFISAAARTLVTGLSPGTAVVPVLKRAIVSAEQETELLDRLRKSQKLIKEVLDAWGGG